MFFRMVLGALARGRSGRVMIAATTALGTAVATAMLGVMFDVGDKVNQELKTYGANIVVQGRGAAVLDELYDMGNAGAAGRAPLAEADIPNIKTIFWAFNIVDFAPFLDATARLETSPPAGQGTNADGADVNVVGTWFAHHLDLPTGEHAVAGILGLRSWWEVQGGWIADGDEDLAMVGADLAAERGLDLGDEFTLSGADPDQAGETAPGKETQPVEVTLRVAGIFTSATEDDSAAVVPLATAQRLAGRAGQVDAVEVSALTTPDNDLARKAARNPEALRISEWESWYCTAYVSSIAYQIEEALPGAVAKAVRAVTESSGSILEKTSLLMLLVTVLSLVASALAIANLVTASVIERAPQIGLLKAVGASDASVLRLVLTELCVIALAGGLVGYGLGLGFGQIVGQVVFGSAIAVRPVVAALVGVLVLLVVLGGSLPSIRMLLRLRPADVLHGR
ncbi:MAG: FtsX-like permease family protein [Bifidobacteriaceae bacterium]|jgi:putative ABC transport system permease protein|nr:FtsX-like permease family protein [Bifidobacteriaceae bacterium]